MQPTRTIATLPRPVLYLHLAMHPIPIRRLVHSTITLRLILAALVAACGERTNSSRTGAMDTSAAASQAASATLASAPDLFMDRDGVTIRYRIVGSGSPLLLLHGYTDRLEMWNGTADSLALHHQVIVPDIRGFGHSVPLDPAAPFGQAMVDDQVALLDALGIERAHVVGYSMGGLMAANLALRFPTRVMSTTFVAGAFLEDSAETSRIFAPYIAAIETDEGLIPFFRYILPTWPDSLIVPAAEQFMADNDPRVLVRVAESLGSLALDWTRVRQSTVPAVAVVGTVDGIRDMSERVASRWPAIRYLEVAGGDHADITFSPHTVAAVRLAVASSTTTGTSKAAASKLR